MKNETSIGSIFKVVLLTAGSIYLVHLLTWFLHWGVVAAAVGGVGYVAYRIGAAGRDRETPRQLTAERPFDSELRRLEAEERELDRTIGL